MLDEIINKFMKKVSDQNDMLQNKVKNLEKQAADIKSQIQTLMKELISAELSSDEAKQKSIDIKLKKLRIDLSDIEDRVSAFKRAESDLAFSQEDIEQLKANALKARHEREQKEIKALQDYKDMEKYIEDLNRTKDEKWSQYQQLSIEREITDLIKVTSYIDPRSSKLSYDNEKEFIKAWLLGYDTERFFKEPEPYRGMVVTGPILNTNDVNPVPKPETKVTVFKPNEQ